MVKGHNILEIENMQLYKLGASTLNMDYDCFGTSCVGVWGEGVSAAVSHFDWIQNIKARHFQKKNETPHPGLSQSAPPSRPSL